ncbi:MAG: BlaI/MecI/CopY family transcriptional regulator [Bdellovibrionota bacterium]
MKKPSKEQEKKLLTETELELMQIIWNLGEATVKEVIQHLPNERQLAYTSVSTIIRILEKKEIVTSRKGNGNSYIYTPQIMKSEYEQASLGHLLKNVFSDTPSSLIRTLVDTMDLSKSDLVEIKKILLERLDP